MSLRPPELEAAASRGGLNRNFNAHHAVYEFKAQLWADAKTQPIEDWSVDWPVSLSQYRTVATPLDG